MRFIRYTISREGLLSRIPSLFPYMEWDGDGRATIHSAADSVDGSYGKIVPDLRMPCNVSLCTYVSVPSLELQEEYWANHPSATIKQDMGVRAYADDMGPLYYRHQTGFSYLQQDAPDEGSDYVTVPEVPVVVTADSDLYIKTPIRDPYGNEITDCDGNVAYLYYKKETDYEYYEKQCLIQGGECYSYSDIMQTYYKYKDIAPSDNSFLVFVERAIGKVIVNKEYLGLSNIREYPLVPSEIYLAEVYDLYLGYLADFRKCRAYNERYVSHGETDVALCQECEVFKKKGGERFMLYLKSLLPRRDALASEYLCMTTNADCGGPFLSFNLPLFHTHNDMGVRDLYINHFEPGRRYYHGEFVLYNDRTYVVQLNRFVQGAPNNYQYVKCIDDFYMLSNNAYLPIIVGEVSTAIPMDVMFHSYQFIHIGDTYYRFLSNGYEPIEMTEYTTGLWDDMLLGMVFDTTHMVLITDLFVSENAENVWYDHQNHYGSRYKIFVDVPSLPIVHTFDYIRSNGSFFRWDDSSSSYIADSENALYYTVQGRASSQLNGFRRFLPYVNISDIEEVPEEGEDWLFYYRIGAVVMTGNISRDDHGNIQRWSDTGVNVGQVVEDLYAYGDILTDITFDRASKTITFTYVIGAHLKATIVEINVDTDNTLLYKYENFTYDDADYHGVIYTETYYYDTSTEISDLVNRGEFDNYVRGDYDNDPAYMFSKFAFSTARSMSTRSAMNSNGERANYPCIISNYTTTVYNEMDFTYMPLYKKEYLMGFSFSPVIDSDVAIDRGSAAAFERHIRLGEIQTFEDLENYSFFSLSET